MSYNKLRETSSHSANPEGAGPSSSAGLQLASTNGGALAGAPLAPSAPPLPLSLMEHISGYETLHSEMPAPPPYEGPAPSVAAPAPLPPTNFNLEQYLPSDAEALEALLGEVRAHCCWGSKAARNARIVSRHPHACLHYTLETWSEARRTDWAHEPFVGQPVDPPSNGPAPLPFAVFIAPPAPFTPHRASAEVPHTASVKPCYHCNGSGRINCATCNGRGRRRCCNIRDCETCRGEGEVSCNACGSVGNMVCPTCAGRSSLKFSIRVTAEWNVTTDHHLCAWNEALLPAEKVRAATGHVLFEEQQLRVAPLVDAPDPDLITGSTQLIQRHAARIGLVQRILLQRHRVRSVPVGEFTYVVGEGNADTHKFFVYGLERLMHAPGYPQRCCCGCCSLL
jgi:hypothetical protein